jgi:transglutaminase-like putative cysteine protease
VGGVNAAPGTAILDLRGGSYALPHEPVRAGHHGRIRLGAFALLGLYGILRWATLVTPAPTWRLFGLLGLALLVAGALTRVRVRSGTAAVIAACASVIAVLAICGIPLAWIVHVRIAVTARAIGQGLSALPHVLVPYSGVNDNVRLVCMLGAGALLIDAAIVLAYTPPDAGEGRQAIAALPLIVLAVLPSTLIRPSVAYLHGLLLFVLLAAFLWGERVGRYEAPAAAGLAGLAALIALIAAPGLDRHSPWLNYQSLAGSLSAQAVDRFDWAQHYGPLNWPRDGREVLEVRAAHPDYWKAENLDVFNGTGWSSGYPPLGSNPPPPDPSAITQYSQDIQVTIRAMRTSNVIGAGFSTGLEHMSEGVVPGPSQGTWTALNELVPGDAYVVRSYSPHPSPDELDHASPLRASAALAGYRTMILPVAPNAPGAPEIVFPSFHAGGTATSISGVYGYDGERLVADSPYAPVYALARRLAAISHSEIEFVTQVQAYLNDGFTYDENPPARRYPLVSFLLRDRRGYCQQFAGAMALLLRMGGVPARVAVGFTTGAYDQAGHHWAVSDLDAHAWVEAWFPRYGFVRFDPTPASAPARADQATGGAASQAGKGAKTSAPHRKPEPATPTGAGSVGRRVHARTPGDAGALLLLAGLLALAVVLWLLIRRPPRTIEEQLAELERALRRAGRPVGAGVTLAGLERRFGGAPDAAAYIRAIRLARFGGTGTRPTSAQRRALRAELGSGLGPLGRLRALWALPPHREGRGPRPHGA